MHVKVHRRVVCPRRRGHAYYFPGNDTEIPVARLDPSTRPRSDPRTPPPASDPSPPPASETHLQLNNIAGRVHVLPPTTRLHHTGEW